MRDEITTQLSKDEIIRQLTLFAARQPRTKIAQLILALIQHVESKETAYDA